MADTFVSLGLALGLGLLVGFQRERSERNLAGIRTFPLITLGGALAGQLKRWAGAEWILAAGFVSLAALLVAGSLRRAEADTERGVTTEVAALVMFMVGATAAVGPKSVAVVMGGVVAVLLYFKRPMHALARRLTDAEVRAVMRIVLIGLVILPVLPDRTYGPYQVLNPFRIWLMVVLIVGLSVMSYVLYKLTDARAGTLLGGILGGLISSTATTASYARRAQADRAFASMAAVVLMVASTVVFLRIFVEVGAVSGTVLRAIAAPLAVMAIVNVSLSGLGFWWWGRSSRMTTRETDPTDLRAALVFAALYGAVLFAVAAAKEHLGDAGLYGVAAISGLTDVDAITLSVANLAEAGRVEAGTAWRAILVATSSNLVFKSVLAFSLGSAAVFRRIAPLFGGSLAAGLVILFAWP